MKHNRMLVSLLLLVLSLFALSLAAAAAACTYCSIRYCVLWRFGGKPQVMRTRSEQKRYASQATCPSSGRHAFICLLPVERIQTSKHTFSATTAA